MPLIGLTGAVGAGKSVAARAFAEHGCAVIDVDALGHEALDDAGVLQVVGREFGDDVVGPEGRADRRRLAARVFGDRDALTRLEAIVHPWVLRRIDHELLRARRQRPRAIVIDCALLFESRLDARCDTTVVVEAAAELRRARTAVDRGWSADEFARREAAQLPASAKRERAKRTLRNEGDLEDLRRGVAALLDEIAPAAEARGPAGRRASQGRATPDPGRIGR